MNQRVCAPTLVCRLPQKVVQIQAGTEHSFCITNNNEVYAWGNNQNAVLGISIPSHTGTPRSLDQSRQSENTAKQVVSRPTRIEGVRATKISVGSRHVFAWHEESSKVYCWGSNQNMELGLESQSQTYPVTKSTLFQQASQYGLRVKSLACGDSHSLAIVEQCDDTDQTIKSRSVFGWGSSKSQQLTLESNLIIPTPVQCQLKQVPIQIYSKSDYCMALCQKEDGNALYVWGSNTFGRLGIGQDVKIQRLPKMLVGIDKQILKVGLGEHHTVVVTFSGEAYSWGLGLQGQLGLGRLAAEGTPCPIDYLRSNQILVKDVSCGRQHTLLLSREGVMYSCGSNQYQCLGHSGNLDEKKRSLLPYQLGWRAEKVEKVSCGSHHCLALTTSGSVYGWGDNSKGQVGTAIAQQQSRGQRIETQTDIKPSKEKSKEELINAWYVEYDNFVKRKNKEQKEFMDRLSDILRISQDET